MTTTTVPAAEAIAPFDVAALEDLGIPALPTEREALRRHLLDAIARIRPILEPTPRPTTPARRWPGRRWSRCTGRV